MENEKMTKLEDEIGEIVNRYEADNEEFVSNVDIIHVGDSKDERPKAYVEIVTRQNLVHDRANEKRIINKLKEREKNDALPESSN